jgi:hypothetical protein
MRGNTLSNRKDITVQLIVPRITFWLLIIVPPVLRIQGRPILTSLPRQNQKSYVPIFALGDRSEFFLEPAKQRRILYHRRTRNAISRAG